MSGDTVLALVQQGMRAESKGDPDEARELFERAWASAGDDYDRCVAAHFLARHQPTPDDNRLWNEAALRLADAVAATDPERVRAFYPSLHLNLGYAWEALGELDTARRHYLLAAAGLADLPDDAYGAMIRGGVAEGLRRLDAAGGQAQS